MYLKKYLHFLPSKCSPPTCGQAVLRTEPRPKPSTAAAALIFLYVNSTRAREPLRLCARLLSQENHAHLSRYPKKVNHTPKISDAFHICLIH
mmetsp:Transcript_16814/g.23044  ORF Transcript_16814/g.23044 Transcript_16814/m.23044 type:complete len:92 (+) Transcript_16814:1069-1344(+)